MKKTSWSGWPFWKKLRGEIGANGELKHRYQRQWWHLSVAIGANDELKCRDQRQRRAEASWSVPTATVKRWDRRRSPMAMLKHHNRRWLPTATLKRHDRCGLESSALPLSLIGDGLSFIGDGWAQRRRWIEVVGDLEWVSLFLFFFFYRNGYWNVLWLLVSFWCAGYWN